VSEDKKTVEKYYPILTESLNSFGNIGNFEIVVSPPNRNDSIVVIPEMIKIAEEPHTFEPDTNSSGNIIILCTTKYREPFDPTRLFILIPFSPFILWVIIVVIYNIVKYKKRKSQTKKMSVADEESAPQNHNGSESGNSAGGI